MGEKTIPNYIFEYEKYQKLYDDLIEYARKNSSPIEKEKNEMRAKACLDIEYAINILYEKSSTGGKGEIEKLSACWEEIKNSGRLFD